MNTSKHLSISFVFLAAASLLLGGCGDKKETPKKGPAPKSAPPASAPPASAPSGGTTAMPKISDADMKTAKEYFGTYCSTCHGKEGMGDGPAGKALNPKPRNFHDAEWRKKATWERVHTVIKKGGAAAGLSPLMAPAPMYQDNPGVINALTKICLDFAK